MTDAFKNEDLNSIFDEVDSVEEIADPLDGLVDRFAADPGAPFMPDVLARLCELRREDRAAFEGLRSRLKKAGCRVTALDDALVRTWVKSPRTSAPNTPTSATMPRIQ